MAYQVIARKWRPQTFEEVTGQEAITRTLRNAIEHERLHHAYLFSGARGVGKTTTARLLAKALNCHKTGTPNPKPCTPTDADACVSCREIAEGRSIDVLEIDAASNTGVDNVREVIINNLGISPARDRYKVFIIDEVHMLSTSSFNALLKSVEEPPPRVVFIMATTELHKVPDTILSRCQEFEFRTIATQKIFDRLKLIADAEQINIAEAALREIARAGEGSMRDAQSAFDQVISFSGEQIATEDVITALGLASSQMLAQTVNAIAEKNPRSVLLVVEELTRRGQDLRNFCRDLLAHFRDLLVAKIAPDNEELVESAASSRAELSKQTADFTEADLIRFFNSLSDTEMQLRTATQPRYVLEVGLIKLIEMRRVSPIENILERLAGLEGVNSGNGAPIQSNSSFSPLVKPPAASKPIDLTDFADPHIEKKTLTVDFPASEVPFPVATEKVSFAPEAAPAFAPAVAESVQAVPAFAPEAAIAPPVFAKSLPDIIPAAVIEAPVREEPLPVSAELPSIPNAFPKDVNLFVPDDLPFKLPPITAEDLEHVDDTWLDNFYEDRLRREGDDLAYIENAPAIAAAILSLSVPQAGSASNTEPRTNGSSGTAFAPARVAGKPAFVMPAFEVEEISQEMPVLPDNPTEEDLWRYAENHPKIKLALRIFRGKITNVTRADAAKS